MTKPNSLRHLDDAIRRSSGNAPEEYVRLRTAMANAVVAQLLPDGVVKGGSAIKMRFDAEPTRFTTDLDVATETNVDEYIEKLAAKLATGWEGFTGRIVPREPASPANIPSEYIMQPFDIKLSYLNKPWCTVPLEIGHNEVGDANHAESFFVSSVSDVFESLGFPALNEVPLMPLTHQIAQKLHAVTGNGDRVRDLVDLQLIMQRSEVSLPATRAICERLFCYRNSQAWPPRVEKRPSWDDGYKAAARSLPVAEDVDEAIDLVNDLIAKIDAAQ